MSNQDTQGGDHGALERELAALMEELRAQVKPAVQRWLDQRLEQGVRAFLAKGR